MALVLLTGASGFVGGHLLRELLAQGHAVRALSRSTQSDQRLQTLGAQPVRGSLLDASSLQRATQGVSAVFHCAANTSVWARDRTVQMATNVDGTRHLLAASTQAGIACFIHTSSVSAYSHLVHGPLREDRPQLGGQSWISYERSKFLAEQCVRESAVPYLIFNPAHILGPGDTQNWARLIQLVDKDRLPGVPPGSGAFADVREIAKAQVQAWQTGVRNEAFLLGGQQASFLHLVQLIAQNCGQKPPQKVMPIWLLKCVAQMSEGWSYLTGKEPQITPASVAFTCHHLQVDSSKAMRMLGYQETNLSVLLGDTMRWMRTQGLLKSSSTDLFETGGMGK